MTIPGARTRSRILGLDGPHRGMFCLAWDWTVTLSIRLVTPCNHTPPRSAWMGSGSSLLAIACPWGTLTRYALRGQSKMSHSDTLIKTSEVGADETGIRV